MPVISLDEARSELSEAIGADSLALFVGAGVSIASPSNCPSWHELTGTFIRALASTGQVEGKPALMALLGVLPEHMMATLRRPEHTFQILTDTLGDEVLEGLVALRTGDPNTNHFLIGGYLYLGALRAVVTTNFDQHLEQVAELYESVGSSPSGQPFIHIRGKNPLQEAPVRSSRLLWTIHGSLSDLSGIIASTASTGRPLHSNAISALRTIIEDNILLVVGYSANDEDILEVLLAPDTVEAAKGVVWQIMDINQLQTNQTLARLESAYGKKFRIVKTSAEELFGLVFDPILIGPPGLPRYRNAIDWLRVQWRMLLFRSMTAEASAALSKQFQQEFDALAATRHFTVSYDEPGSLWARVSYNQQVLTMLEGPAAGKLLGAYVSTLADGYRRELTWLRANAPGIAINRYSQSSVMLTLATLLVSCRCFEQAIEVCELALEQISGETDFDLARALSLDVMASNDSWPMECYRRLKALRAIALICIGRPSEALTEVAFATSLIMPAFISGSVHRNRSVEQALLAQVWAMIKLSDQFDYSEIRNTTERFQTVERGLGTIGVFQHLLNIRSAFDRDFFTLVRRHDGINTLTRLIEDQVHLATQAGDLLRIALLKALQVELLSDVLPLDAVTQRFEESYEDIRRLGAVYELLELCRRAAIVDSKDEGQVWKRRVAILCSEVIESSPDHVRPYLAKFMERV